MQTIKGVFASVALALAGVAIAAPSEISVNLKLDNSDYVCGERIRGVITVANSSPDEISVGRPDSRDVLIVEVYRAGDRSQVDKISKGNFTGAFKLKGGEGQKLEVFLGDHYGLRDPRRYLARPVLVHAGSRYEGEYRAFEVVQGIECGEALQMFSNRPGVQREFRLVHVNRGGAPHLFLAAKDTGGAARKWQTTDLGKYMRLGKPTVSILPSGEVITIHRYDADNFMRNDFWSLTDALEFRKRELVGDPTTAGQNRVHEIFKESGGIEAKKNPWWKFW